MNEHLHAGHRLAGRMEVGQIDVDQHFAGRAIAEGLHVCQAQLAEPTSPSPTELGSDRSGSARN